MTNEKVVKVVSESLKMEGVRVNLTFDDVTKENAEKLISDIANQLGRTYQFVEGSGLSWFEVVNHDDDKLEIVVFIKLDNEEDV